MTMRYTIKRATRTKELILEGLFKWGKFPGNIMLHLRTHGKSHCRNGTYPVLWCLLMWNNIFLKLDRSAEFCTNILLQCIWTYTAALTISPTVSTHQCLRWKKIIPQIKLPGDDRDWIGDLLHPKHTSITEPLLLPSSQHAYLICIVPNSHICPANWRKAKAVQTEVGVYQKAPEKACRFWLEQSWPAVSCLNSLGVLQINTEV